MDLNWTVSSNCVKKADHRNLLDMPLNVGHSWGTTYGSIWEIVRVRLGSCKTGLSPLKLCVTDRSKAILLWWFFLFYVLVFKFFVLLAPYVCFHIFN